jgi:ribose transport system substrate-binding protein
MRHFKYRIPIAIGAAMTLAIAVGGTQVVNAKTDGGTRASGYTKKDHYTFVVSNNFLGNDYRPQLLKLAQLTANLPPFKGRVTLKVVESQPTTAAQLADLNNIIREKPDAILLEPPDPTAMNPAIKRACAAGIVVIDVDQAATEPCAWTVAEDFYHAQYVIGEWMGQILKGKGSVFVDQGLAGPNIAKLIEQGFTDGLKATAPAIKIAGKYAGSFSQAPSQQAISSLLVGNPNVNGIHNQGYCTPVFNAEAAAHHPAVPATCFAYNGEVQACAKSGRACAIETGAPTGIQIAMKTALDILDGKSNPPKKKVIPNPQLIYVTNKAQFHPKKTFGIPIAQIKVAKCGNNVPPAGTVCSDLPPGMAMPFTLPQYKISGHQAVGKK